MSKKLAEGIDGLVLDVKVGSGAFMKTDEDAAFLAQLLIETGQRMGKRVAALLTDMDQPLGLKIGNALEVEEAIDVLKGHGPRDLRDLCLELVAWMFHAGHPETSVEQGRDRATQLIASGKALDTFRRMIELQGGDPRVVDEPARLPRAKHSLDITSPCAGHVASIQSETVGVAGVVLGGGREKKEDSIDPAVGILLHKKVGDAVAAGESLCTIHYNSESRAAGAKELLDASFGISEAAPRLPKLIRRILQ